MYTRTFSTLGCGELPLNEVIQLARRHGIAQLELRALGGTVDLPDYFTKTFGTPAELAAKFEAENMRVVALDTSFRVIDAGAEDRKKLLEFIPWAEALGVKWLRAFDGGKTLDDDASKGAADSLRWWREERSRCGASVDLMIETHDTLFTAEMLKRFLAAVPEGSAWFLWDTHHTWKKGGEDPLVTWQAIRSRVVHAHVKDSVNAPGEKTGFRYVLPGEGEFPMAPLRAVLAKEFGGAVSLEWEKFWMPHLAPLDEVLSAADRRGWW
jgi:sugar phosphate isomerase/epimerase